MLTWGEVALMMRAAVKDRSYQRTPVGVMVRRYLRWFRNEWGATPTTVRDYEAILARMSRDQHIDPDVFEVFLKSGVYRDYATKFLPPEQIDEVDVGRYLGGVAATTG